MRNHETLKFVFFSLLFVRSFSWEGIEDFQKFGYDVLPCPTYQRSECCVCKNVMKQLEILFENPGKGRNYSVELASSRRPGKPKTRIPYVRSMAGIADALENVCFTNVSLDIAKAETRVTEATDLFFHTCRRFVNDFEEHVQRRAHHAAKTINLIQDVCVEDTKFCETVDGSSTNPPKWYMSAQEHSRILTLLKESVGTVNTIQEILAESKTHRRDGRISDLPEGKSQRIKYLTNSLFFNFGAAAAMTNVHSNIVRWNNLFRNDTIYGDWAVVKVKLQNKIHAIKSFGKEDLFVEVQQDGDEIETL